MRCKQSIAIAAAGIILITSSAAARAQDVDSDWSGQLTLYGWVRASDINCN